MLSLKWLLAFLLLAGQTALAQPRIRRYVQQQAQPVVSIQPGNREYADLAAVGRAVGEARIVLLGEQDHGDGSTMLAKTRLVQYLHEQKGFDVLAFESDFLALNQGWEATPIDSVAQANLLLQNIYPIWSRCQQCSDLLYRYVPRTYRSARPLRVTGFDNQLYGAWSKHHAGPALHAYLTQAGVPFVKSASYARFFRPFLDTLLNPLHFITGTKDLERGAGKGRSGPGPSAIAHKHEKLARFIACLDTISAQLPPAQPADDFNRRLLRNLRVLAQESAVYTEDTNATYNLRDAQMADNLDWLANTKFAGQKIIVWAASFHVAKGQGGTPLQADAPASPAAPDEAIRTMGRVFAENPRNRSQTYTLGFVSGGGSSQRTIVPTATKLPPLRYDSMEKWFPRQYAYAFLDFQPYRAQEQPAGSESFWMNGLGHYSSYARWATLFDGVFYVRTQAPCLLSPPPR